MESVDTTDNVDWISKILNDTKLSKQEGQSTVSRGSKEDGTSGKGYILPAKNLRRIMAQDTRSGLAHRPRGRVQQTTNPVSEVMTYRKDGFCKYCKTLTIGELRRAGETDVFRDDPVTDSAGGHHHSIQDLEVSAKTCPLCRLLVIALRPNIEKLRMMSSPPPASRFKMWVQNFDMDDDEREGKLTHLIYQWHDSEDTVDLLISAFKGTPAAAHIDSQFLDPHADSESNFTKIRGILRFCNETHTRCSPGPHISTGQSMRLLPGERWTKGLPSSVLPTRVVAANYEDHGRAKPFLMETNGQTGVYAALSYRWSTDSQITTTRLTLECNKKELDFGNHTGTRTFRDAIAVCRKLGIPYLWIDALCIIQHDPTDPLSNLDDWDKEAKDMGRVYGDCALTIAATGASNDSSNGLFGDRSAVSQFVEMPFRLEPWDEPDGTFLVSLPPEGFSTEVNDSELYSRGWVMQERLLSHRYLHFGKTQWFWQCRHNTISEVSGFEDQETTIGSNFEIGESESYLDNATKTVRRWMNIVETYSRLNFTVNTDRFVAIHGIVSETAKTSGDRCVYGLWSRLLYVQLLWFIHQRDLGEPSENEASPMPSQENFRPSWSWQSTTRPISYFTQFEGDKFYEKAPNDPLARIYMRTVSVTVIRPAFEHGFTSRASAPGKPAITILVMKTTIGNVNLEFDIDNPSRVAAKKSVIDERYNVTLKARAAGDQMDGKEIGRCNLDRPSLGKYQKCYCIGISENWDQKGEVKELRSMNVLIVLLAKQRDQFCAKRIGEGIVSDKSWFKRWPRMTIVMI